MATNLITFESKITTTDLLGLMFIYLKLNGTIDWSWWWVLFPFWGVLVLQYLVFFYKKLS